MSMKLSIIVAVREGTKLWWYSSISEYPTIRTSELQNHLLLTPDRGEPRKARAARSPRMKYAVKWASFRTIPCTNVRVSDEALGKSHKKSGPMNLDVLLAEKLPEEATHMNAIHKTTGKYLPRKVRRSGDAIDSTEDIWGFQLLLFLAIMGSELPLPIRRTALKRLVRVPPRRRPPL
ncbi:MAG TPA: hypothetical protein VF074_08720 [Pyrinomonadaceae bacterium]